ncbi:hypothetical protein PILCRDRAFT_814277 [Piloderma croceum F 1598]|uniref:Uncharacterized protein n=1 Tax=Piloderma croceum (strain F 1598) TaxID=765440 RepID=A0A0C3CF50_PILCF|nr:hypothetical protein PILCRDRAFT_814277 [Piloderma croceum F 1598]
MPLLMYEFKIQQMTNEHSDALNKRVKAWRTPPHNSRKEASGVLNKARRVKHVPYR